MTIHICRDGEELGQYTQQILYHLIEEGRLLATDYFWIEGMDDWKPLSHAKSYFGHREKCRHCGGKMAEQKPVNEGRHQGQTRSICLKCAHTEYHV